MKSITGNIYIKKLVAECIGTFALVFCGTGAIIIDQQTGGGITHVGIAITFGLIVMAMIYSLGDISGAHLNPAVTIAFMVARKFPMKEVIPYIIFQLSGAISASMVLKFLFPENQMLGMTVPAGSETQSFVIEVILTFLLMFVILNVTRGTKEKGLFAGISIGSVVLLEAMFAGKITGASMNPARSIAPSVVSGNLAHLWLYIVAPIAGALISIPVSNFIKPKE